ncbi:hypothetical protein ACA910_002936 [Epithemia clementina (nom. ined.)]
MTTTWLVSPSDNLSNNSMGNRIDLDPQSSSAVFAQVRHDRSGMVITEMLNAHAYAFAHNLPYGGYCKDHKNSHRVRAVEEILDVMGWQSVLPMKCPNQTLHQQSTKREHYHNALYEGPSNVFAFPNHPWIKYMQRHTNYTIDQEHQYFAPPSAAVESMQNHQTTATTITSNKNRLPARTRLLEPKDYFRVAVHIRRGDVTPCMNQHQERYSPNAHYLRLLEYFLPPDEKKSEYYTVGNWWKRQIYVWWPLVRGHKWRKPPPPPVHYHRRPLWIQLFAVSDSPYENFTLLEHDCNALYRNNNKNSNSGYPHQSSFCQLELDTPQWYVWKSIAVADVVVLSKSTFSYIPAMLNRNGTIIYTAFARRPMAHWTRAPTVILKESQRIVEEELAYHPKCQLKPKPLIVLSTNHEKNRL